MHYTFHLTTDCNMKCRYCYSNTDKKINMSEETALKAVDFAIEHGGESIGITFFGGEPLLKKELIFAILEYTRHKSVNGDMEFLYQITTNGTLLDEEFIDHSVRDNIFIALSHDGIKKSHDMNRIFRNEKGTFDSLEAVMDLLIVKCPNTPVMAVVTPNTVEYYYESVVWLYEKGFKNLIFTLDYSGVWDEKSIKELKKQYKKLSGFYYRETLKESQFFFSPFDVKISSHINNRTYSNDRCELGRKNLSIGPDGKIYPCIKFIDTEDYSIGSIHEGIDTKKQMKLFYMSSEVKSECRECKIKDRCNNTCGCVNYNSTGYVNKVSPSLCAHERTILPIADKIAEKLYKKRNGMFIQKHYNDYFPLINELERKLKND